MKGRTVLALLLWCELACSANHRSAIARGEQELRRATERYVDLVLAMDSAGIAALFTSDGEMSAEGRPPIRSRAAIQAHLETFKEYHVLEESLTTDRVEVVGDSGQTGGVYRQRVRIPSGEVVEVGGTYEADWLRDPGGAWRIRRMSTSSKR